MKKNKNKSQSNITNKKDQFLEAIQRGIADADAGRVYTSAEVKSKLGIKDKFKK